MTAIDTTVELPAPTNLLNPPRFSPVVVTPEIVTLPDTSKFALFLTNNFELSNVKFAESSSSPEVPTTTIRSSVKSAIEAESAARVSMFAVPSMNKS